MFTVALYFFVFWETGELDVQVRQLWGQKLRVQGGPSKIIRYQGARSSSIFPLKVARTCLCYSLSLPTLKTCADSLLPASVFTLILRVRAPLYNQSRIFLSLICPGEQKAAGQAKFLRPAMARSKNETKCVIFVPECVLWHVYTTYESVHPSGNAPKNILYMEKLIYFQILKLLIDCKPCRVFQYT